MSDCLHHRRQRSAGCIFGCGHTLCLIVVIMCIGYFHLTEWRWLRPSGWALNIGMGRIQVLRYRSMSPDDRDRCAGFRIRGEWGVSVWPSFRRNADAAVFEVPLWPALIVAIAVAFRLRRSTLPRVVGVCQCGYECGKLPQCPECGRVNDEPVGSES
jgi:hypothetical protein